MFIGENLGAGESNTTGASPISDLISPSKIHQWWRYIFDSSLKLHALGFFSSILAFSFCCNLQLKCIFQLIKLS